MLFLFVSCYFQSCRLFFVKDVFRCRLMGLIQISGGNSETVFKSYEICASQSRITIALYTGLVFHTYGNNVYHMVIIILYLSSCLNENAVNVFNATGYLY